MRRPRILLNMHAKVQTLFATNLSLVMDTGAVAKTGSNEILILSVDVKVFLMEFREQPQRKVGKLAFNTPYILRIYICFADINECILEPRKCQHHCVNTNGGFHCNCRRGYRGDGMIYGSGCTRNDLLIVKSVTG